MKRLETFSITITQFEKNYMNLMKSDQVELLGITIANNVNFHKYMSNISLKANRKLSNLRRKVNYILF